MTKADLHQLVDALRDAAIEGAGLFFERVLRRELDPDQAWVWSTDWQDQLRSSLADFADGRTRRFASSDEFLASL